MEKRDMEGEPRCGVPAVTEEVIQLFYASVSLFAKRDHRHAFLWFTGRLGASVLRKCSEQGSACGRCSVSGSSGTQLGLGGLDQHSVPLPVGQLGGHAGPLSQHRVWAGYL